jgi:hypothetical protein
MRNLPIIRNNQVPLNSVNRDFIITVNIIINQISKKYSSWASVTQLHKYRFISKRFEHVLPVSLLVLAMHVNVE